MNFLRRVYLLLLGLLLVIMVTLLLLSPQAVGTWVGSISELSLVVRIIITVVVDLLLLALMYLQVRPDPGSKVAGLLMRGSGAVTEVSVESARERILKAVSDVPDVISAEATVKPVRGRAEIEMQVVVMGDEVRLPSKQKDINRALRQVIDKQLGLQIAGQPRIHIRIHGDEPVKPLVPAPVAPVVTTPPVMPIIEKEPPIILPTKVEPEPEPRPLSSLFGGRGHATEEKVKDDVEQKSFLDKPLEPEPEVPVKPRTSLFGAGWRDHDKTDEVKEESEPLPPSISGTPGDVVSTPLIVPKSEETVPSAQPEPESQKEETGVKADDGDKALKLNLDEELSHADVDDFNDEESDKPEESLIDVTEDETPDSKKPDETTL